MKHKCPVCGKQCRAGGAFVSHMRMHVNENKAIEKMVQNVAGKWKRVFLSKQIKG